MSSTGTRHSFAAASASSPSICLERRGPIKADLGAERMFSRVIDYLGTRSDVDSSRIVVWGVSWGGHWAAQSAYTERARLRGAVVQGGPVNDYFSADWQKKSLNTPEYLFDLFAARSAVYGVKTLDEFYAYGPRLSLKGQGYLGSRPLPCSSSTAPRIRRCPSPISTCCSSPAE